MGTQAGFQAQHPSRSMRWIRVRLGFATVSDATPGFALQYMHARWVAYFSLDKALTLCLCSFGCTDTSKDLYKPSTWHRASLFSDPTYMVPWGFGQCVMQPIMCTMYLCKLVSHDLSAEGHTRVNWREPLLPRRLLWLTALLGQIAIGQTAFAADTTTPPPTAAGVGLAC